MTHSLEAERMMNKKKRRWRIEKGGEIPVAHKVEEEDMTGDGSCGGIAVGGGRDWGVDDDDIYSTPQARAC